MKGGWRNFIGSGCYLGLIPVAPGSFGALIGLAWLLAGFYAGIGAGWPFVVWSLVAAVAVSAAHYKLTPWAQKFWNDPDPGHFVLDEVVGTLAVFVFYFGRIGVSEIVAGYLLFRVFDIIKLPGARWIDRNVHTATGVLFDDVVSALYAAVVLWLWKYWGAA